MEQDTPPADFDPRDTHAEMAVLRLLVEAMLANMEEDAQIDVVIAFKEVCARAQAELLAQPLSERALQAMDRAIAGQQHRLVMGGIAAPGLFGEG